MAEGRRRGERACRFDLVEVWVEPAGALRVEVLRDAFRPRATNRVDRGPEAAAKEGQR